MMRTWLTLIPLMLAAQAPPTPLLSNQESTALCRRAIQLIESTSVAVPGLIRAGAPILENARQALLNLESGPAGHSGLTYDVLVNVRAYLELADAVPKPYPFAEEARRQMAELRENVDRLEAHFRALLDQRETLVRGADRDNLKRYAEANERLDKPSPASPRVLFLGDSITDGWRLNEYFPGRDFVNRGISGQITGQMLGRMKADVTDLKPAAMIVLAGTNDIARGVELKTIQNNLTMIAELADAHRIKLLLCSVLPVSDYHKDQNLRFEMSKTRPPATILALNGWLESFAKQKGYLYVDYFHPMMDGGGFMMRDLADDGLHPNSKGYRVMAPIALEAIDRALGRGQAPPQPKKKRLGIF